MREALSFRYAHTDAEVIDAAAEVIDEVMDGEDGSVALMLENLWYPGLNLLDPEMTRRLLERISYPNKGIMLDTGHLMHTDFSLASQAEALEYLGRVLDAHERAGVLPYFRGMHLQQSLTGEFCRRLQAHPPELSGSWTERCGVLFENIFKIDRHLPFTAPGVRALVDRLPLEYLTFEFITESREQLGEFHSLQWDALGRDLMCA